MCILIQCGHIDLSVKSKSNFLGDTGRRRTPASGTPALGVHRPALGAHSKAHRSKVNKFPSLFIFLVVAQPGTRLDLIRNCRVESSEAESSRLQCR
jgi:hypothetical protein